LQAVGGRWRVTTGFCSCEVARPATGTVSSRAPPGRSVAYSSSGLSSSAPKNATECSSITTKPSCTIRIHPVLSWKERGRVCVKNSRCIGIIVEWKTVALMATKQIHEPYLCPFAVYQLCLKCH
jgi:hypothetical protein